MCLNYVANVFFRQEGRKIFSGRKKSVELKTVMLAEGIQ
jgi:hypothetical protein